MFSSYVSNVPPELGEENMQQVTFQEYLNRRLSNEFQVENPYELLEYVLTKANTPSYRSRLESTRFKASTRFFDAIQLYRQSLELSGMRFKDITFSGKPIVTAQQITEWFYSNDTSLRFHNRLEKLVEWSLKEIKEVQRVEWKKAWVQEEIELLSNEEYHRAHRYLAEKRGFKREAIADYEMEPKALAQLIVHQKLKPLKKRVRAFRFIDFKAIYKQLFADPKQIERWMEGETPVQWTDICQVTLKMLDENKLLYEDATPFLLLKELIQGFQSNSSIKQIVVDEAQDYSPFQFEFLKRLFPAARMTVLGDFNQAIFAHASERADFNTLTSLYGADETELINITRSYRSTKPIIEFTRRLVPNGDKIVPFERKGEKPVLKQVTDHAELHRRIATKVAEYRSLGLNSIAIICKSAEESARAYESLTGIDEIKLLKKRLD